MGSNVIHTDLELYLVHYLQDRLAEIAAGPLGAHQALADGVYVGSRHPPERRPKTVVVRDDGGPTTSLVTKNPSVGVTILAGDDETDGQEATDLALLVAALVAGSPGTQPGNPIAAVLEMNGPYAVKDESGQPRRYFTASLVVAGQEFTL